MPPLNILEGAPMCFGSLSPSLKNSLFNDYWTREVVKRTKTVSFFVRPSFQLRSCVLHLTLLALFPIVLELRKLSNSSYNFNLSKSLIDKIRIHSALKKFTHLKFNFRVILMLLLAVTKDCSTISPDSVERLNNIATFFIHWHSLIMFPITEHSIHSITSIFLIVSHTPCQSLGSLKKMRGDSHIK